MKSTFFEEEQTKKELCKFIMQADRLSMDKKCKEFEKEFSKFQKRKYSVLYNSGSSANLALIQALINLDKIHVYDKVGFSAVTWATNVMPLIQLGLDPVPIDVSLKTLNVSPKELNNTLKEHDDIKAFFITNLLGFCDDLKKIKNICDKNKIILIEDNCESLGSRYKRKLLGNYGLASTFSFFVGHHLSTIEGGMVCTDDEELYKMLVMVRAHGWLRNIENFSSNDFYGLYTFYSLGYNFRPTEITGFLGLNQLKHMEKIIWRRNHNYKVFLKAASKNKDIMKLDIDMDMISNFAYPLIFKDAATAKFYKKKFEPYVEIRPIVGGSILKQPFFSELAKSYRCPNAEKIHNNGFYFANNPELNRAEIQRIMGLMIR